MGLKNVGWLVAGAGAGLVLAIAATLLLDLYDWDQCTRKCRFEYRFHEANKDLIYKNDYGRLQFKSSYMDNKAVRGVRVWAGERGDGTTCDCLWNNGKEEVEIGVVDRLYDGFEQGYPYPWKNETVCGVDGVEYNHPDEAAAAGTKVINCGPCGSCSHVQDVNVYRKYDKPMSKMLARCAMLHLFLAPMHGDELARRCLREVFPELTPGCLERFVDNYGCIIVHCKESCIYKWNHVLSASPNVDGTETLSPCLLCDEMHCSPKFIETGGANRRCSGTNTDIKRPEREVCPYVNAI